MHDPIATTGAWVKRMLQGHLNYFAVSGNHPSLRWFLNQVKRLWLTSLKRRSQTARLSWERFIQLVARFFPPIRTLHPLACHRFDAKTRGRSPVRQQRTLGSVRGARSNPRPYRDPFRHQIDHAAFRRPL
jgi:RNA-directed DNA polymerase